MNAIKYTVSGQAEQDVTEIMLWIASDDVDTSVRLLDRLYQVFEFLAENPRAGRERSEIETGLRSFPDGRYMIFYRIWASELLIVRVIDSARDLDEIFS